MSVERNGDHVVRRPIEVHGGVGGGEGGGKGQSLPRGAALLLERREHTARAREVVAYGAKSGGKTAFAISQLVPAIASLRAFV